MTPPANSTEPRNAAKPLFPATAEHPAGVRRAWWPVALLMLLAAGSVVSLLLSAPAKLFTLRATDVWFQADVARVLGHMSEPERFQGRINVHPVFALSTAPAVRTVKALTGLGNLPAATGVLALIGAGIAGLFWCVVRNTGRSRTEAFLLTLLLMSSSTWLFWFSVTETYPLGALTVLLALWLATRKPETTRAGGVALTAAASATCFATVTNGMFGLLLLWLKSARRRVFLLRAADALAVVAVLFLVQQRWLFGKDASDHPLASESKFLLTEASGGPLTVSKVLLLDSLVAPTLEPVVTDPQWSWLSMQRSRPGSGSGFGLFALGLWVPLLLLGAAGLWHARRRLPVFARLLAGGFCGQGLLHVLYGEESFLYTFHLLPLLMLCAAFAFERTALRKWTTGAVAALIALSLANNLIVLRGARDHVEGLRSARAEITGQMEARPTDDWPRSAGRLVVGLPGAPAAEKAFLEPGGSFSPVPASFGVSWSVADASGRRMATDAGETEQRWGTDSEGRVFAVFTTPYYRGCWTRQNAERWELNLEAGPSAASGHRVEMLLRGVGPAAGPLTLIEQNTDDSLRLNQRWLIRLPAGSAVTGADESLHGLAAAQSNPPIRSTAGWAFARVSLALPARIEIVDTQAGATAKQVPPKFTPGLPSLALPDPRFAECLRAQVMLLAGAVEGKKLMPFDPFMVPDAWARVSAQAVAALVRAGNIEFAKPLALELAEHDFYGPFGSEADAPGLALWAMEEVAARANDPAFDRALLPHVRRKAELILRFARATGLEFAPPEYSYAGRYEADLFVRNETGLVCLPAQDGLIAGRCERWIAPLQATAAGYRGLLDAAALARRVGLNDEDAGWTAEAGRLKQAWLSRVRTDKAGRAERLGRIATAAREGWRQKGFYLARDAALLAAKQADEGEQLRRSAVWPSWIGADADELLLKKIPPKTSAAGAPPAAPHTAFAHAHQRLLLGDMTSAWQTLTACWPDQAVPGAWVFRDQWTRKNWIPCPWDGIRGGLQGGAASPSTRNAAELLSLQLDMLAYLDESGAEPVIVIGAGVPEAWLAQPMHVSGLALKGATVGWSWDGRQLAVSVEGRRLTVRTAGAFAETDPLLTLSAPRTTAAHTEAP